MNDELKEIHGRIDGLEKQMEEIRKELQALRPASEMQGSQGEDPETEPLGPGLTETPVDRLAVSDMPKILEAEEAPIPRDVPDETSREKEPDAADEATGAEAGEADAGPRSLEAMLAGLGLAQGKEETVRRPTDVNERRDEEKSPGRPAAPHNPAKEPDFEHHLSVWLPRVFMVILLLGVLWGLKVSFDMGWITPGVRIVLGYLASILLGYLGFRSVRRARRGYGLTLWGGTVALGILTTFAANQLYGFLSLPAAFAVGVGYVAAGLYAALRTDSETLTVFTAIAGFLLPFLLEGEGASALMFCAYVLFLFLAVFGVSVRGHHRVTFYVVFALFNLTLLAYLALDGIRGGHENLVAGTALIQHLVLLFFYLKGNIPRQVFTEVLLYVNFAAGLMWTGLFDEPLMQVVYGVTAVLYAALAGYARLLKDTPLQDILSAITVAAAAVFILSFRLEEPAVQFMILFITGAAGIWAALRFGSVRTLAVSGVLYAMTAMFTLLFGSFDVFFSVEHAAWLMFLGTFAIVYAAFYQHPPVWLKREKLDASLIAGQVAVMVYLFRMTGILMQNTSLTYGPEWHVRLGILGAAAFGSYFLQRFRNGRFVSLAGAAEVLLLGVVLFALPMSNWGGGGYWISLAVGLLFAAGITYLFVQAAKDRFPVRQRLPLPAAAFVLQLIYFMLLNKWFFAGVREHGWGSETTLFVHTFLLFLFAFLSITAGRSRDWRAVRIAGFVLLGFSFLKLFIVDMATVSIMIRAILFILVGIAGLVYSRTLQQDSGKGKRNDHEGEENQ